MTNTTTLKEIEQLTLNAVTKETLKGRIPHRVTPLKAEDTTIYAVATRLKLLRGF